MRSNRAKAQLAHEITADEIRHAVDVAAGRRPATLLLRDGRLLNVFDGRIRRVSVAFAGRLIATVGSDDDAPAADTTIDLHGAYLAPGLIDGHVHIESSLVTPAAYAEGVVPRGVTGVVCDPHEIANVAGVPGVQWLLERSRDLPLDVWVTVPSSVPSTAMETAGSAAGTGGDRGPAGAPPGRGRGRDDELPRRGGGRRRRARQGGARRGRPQDGRGACPRSERTRAPGVPGQRHRLGSREHHARGRAREARGRGLPDGPRGLRDTGSGRVIAVGAR